MKQEILFWIVFIILTNIILFLTCVMPWYAVLVYSSWWLFAAIPFTSFGAFLCCELFLTHNDFCDGIEDDWWD